MSQPHTAPSHCFCLLQRTRGRHAAVWGESVKLCCLLSTERICRTPIASVLHLRCATSDLQADYEMLSALDDGVQWRSAPVSDADVAALPTHVHHPSPSKVAAPHPCEASWHHPPPWLHIHTAALCCHCVVSACMLAHKL